jgi:hypothetical protein
MLFSTSHYRLTAQIDSRPGVFGTILIDFFGMVLSLLRPRRE